MMRTLSGTYQGIITGCGDSGDCVTGGGSSWFIDCVRVRTHPGSFGQVPRQFVLLAGWNRNRPKNISRDHPLEEMYTAVR
jgi:hypothetical protein